MRELEQAVEAGRDAACMFCSNQYVDVVAACAKAERLINAQCPPQLLELALAEFRDLAAALVQLVRHPNGKQYVSIRPLPVDVAA